MILKYYALCACYGSTCTKNTSIIIYTGSSNMHPDSHLNVAYKSDALILMEPLLITHTSKNCIPFIPQQKIH